MSELAECREAMREPRSVSNWQRALQGGLVEANEETPPLAEFGRRPGKAERDWWEVIGVAASMELWPPGWAEDRLEALEEPDILSLDVELDEPEEILVRHLLQHHQEHTLVLDEPEVVDLTNDPLIMGILAGDIRTLCLDCSERDCPAHPVNGIV